MVAGTALVATGFLMALYGFGNPTGAAPDKNQPWVYPHRTGVAVAGLGVAAGGAILTWHGWHGSTQSASVEAGPHRLKVQHRIRF
jgi:hypothetical protein